MSRIPLTSIEQQPEPVRQWMASRGNLKVFRLLANAPHVFPGWTQMVDELFESPTFSRRMREVVILRVAHLQGSRYELSQHVGIARNAGLTDQQINAILDTDHPDAAGFSDTEIRALASNWQRVSLAGHIRRMMPSALSVSECVSDDADSAHRRHY